MTTAIKSADDIIVATEREKLGKLTPIIPKAPETGTEGTPKTEPEAKKEEKEIIDGDKKPANDEKAPEEHKEAAKKDEKTEEKAQKTAEEEKKALNDEEIDEYGNQVAKKRMYSEEEVQRMMRERFSRGHLAKQTEQEQQQIQNAAKDFTPDPNSEENWESQLETFVENTLSKLANKHQQVEARKQAEESQAEFEIKFNQGMEKYSDFQNVVAGKAVTPAMMMATRGMKDPAAFLYAACKQQPTELDRIAKIVDPYAQATEIGRLEERMKKAKLITSAPVPSKKVTGDAVTFEEPKKSIDQLINEHAKSKLNRR